MIARFQHRPEPHTRLSFFVIALIIPLCFLLGQVYIRHNAGEFWHWYLLDPSYFYLLDGLNVLSGNPPGHIYHPGVTVHSVNAVLIWLHSIFTPGSIQSLVLIDPETYLFYLSNVAIVLNTAVLFILGLAVKISFGAWSPAILCQLAPFMSSIILKHAFMPKPEALLIFGTSLVIALMICSRQENPIIANQKILAVCFGILGGFIVATKLTASPILMLPMILLRGKLPKFIFIAISLLAFAIFFIPAIGAIEEFLEWLKLLASYSGTHGSGPSGFINLDHYPEAVLKILKRPSLKIPLILAFLAICVALWSRKNGHRINVDDLKGLIAISLTQVAHVLWVAKQAAAFYMIPAYMLSAVSILLSSRIFWQAQLIPWRNSLSKNTIGTILLIVVVIAIQITGIFKSAKHYEDLRTDAAKANNENYVNCARIYNYSASSPVFAMYLANYTSGSHFSKDLKKLFPPNHYWIDDWWSWKPVQAKNWDGVVKLKSIITKYPCVIFRGSPRNRVERFLRTELESFKFEGSCRAGLEHIRTLGVECNTAK